MYHTEDYSKDGARRFFRNVGSYQNTWRQIPEDRSLNIHRRNNRSLSYWALLRYLFLVQRGQQYKVPYVHILFNKNAVISILFPSFILV